MEKNETIHLFLDNDHTGKKWLEFAQKRSANYIDESQLYKGHKDLNEWHINFGKGQKLNEIKHSRGRHL